MRFLKHLGILLSSEQRRRLVLLQAYFLISAMLQVVGVASIAPFIAVASQPALIHKNAIAQRLYESAGFTTDTQFLIAFAWLLMCLIVIGNAVMAGGVWLTISFARRLGIELQREVLRGYLNREYERVGRTNSAKLVATFTQGIARFVYMVVQPLLYLNSSGLVALLVIAGLVWFDPIVAMSATFIVGAGYFGIYSFSKKLLERSGRSAWSASKARQRLLVESLGGIKEIKLLGSEAIYEERVDAVSRSALRDETVVGLLSELPRYLLEAIAFCSILGLGIVLLKGTDDPAKIVGLLSVYAMAGYRLLPAAQTIFRSAAQIRANVDIVDELLPDVIEGRQVKVEQPNSESAEAFPSADISFEDVWYTYPGADQPAVCGISLTIPRASITAIVGASGAGKSTVADLLLGLLRPTAGAIRVGGLDVAERLADWRRTMGYVPQTIFLLDDSVSFNIAFDGRGTIDPDRVRNAAKLANLDAFIDSLPSGFDFVVGERGALLSGGQRQRVGIARALYRDANVLVLDEATSALDSVTEREIIDTMSKLKAEKTIVMIAHRLSTIRGADLILVVEDGQLIDSGSFDSLVARSDTFRRLIAAAAVEGMEQDDVVSAEALAS